MRRTKYQRLLAKLLLASATAFSAWSATISSAQAYLVTIDQFVVLKNSFDGVGGNPVYLNDTFSDGSPPPSTSATYPSAPLTPAYITRGAWLESGGRAIADSTNAPEVLPPGIFTTSSQNLNSARFNTNSQAGLPFGLRADADFGVRGLFDLSSVLDSPGRSAYAIELADYYVDTLRLGVVKNSAGEFSLRFYDMDHVAGTHTILDEDILAAGHDQILFMLTHSAVTGFVTASYAYVDSPIDVADSDAVAGLDIVHMSGEGQLFTGVDYTQPGIHVIEFVPVTAPGVLPLFTGGLAFMALARVRRLFR